MKKFKLLTFLLIPYLAFAMEDTPITKPQTSYDEAKKSQIVTTKMFEKIYDIKSYFLEKDKAICRQFLEKINTLNPNDATLKTIAYSLFGWYGVRKATILAHELGHAIFGFIPAKGAIPVVQLRGSGGYTLFRDMSFIREGRLSSITTSLAGPLAGIWATNKILKYSNIYQENKTKNFDQAWLEGNEKSVLNSNHNLAISAAASISFFQNLISFIPLKLKQEIKGVPLAYDGYHILSAFRIRPSNYYTVPLAAAAGYYTYKQYEEFEKNHKSIA